jgi:GST-like protein
LLEELGISYQPFVIDIRHGDQFQSDFLKISPNNRIPAIVDRAPNDGGEPVSLFESGAILLYLAEKHQQWLPTDVRERKTVLEWLFWQVGGLGPMAGQNHHFRGAAPEAIPYAIERYTNETARLYGVSNRQLENREYSHFN